MSRLLDTQLDGAGDIVLSRADVEIARVDATGNITTKGSVNGGSIAYKYDPRLQWLGADIKRQLAAGRSLGLAVLSDSTANNTEDWFHQLGLLIGAQHPEYTIREALFDDTNQSYPVPTVVQTGTSGDRYLNFTGAAGTYSIQNADVTAPTDIDVAVLVSLDDWTPSAAQTLVGHFGAAGNRAWRFFVNASGTFGVQYSSDGTTLLADSSTAAPVIADGTKLWVRYQLQVNDGSGNRVSKWFTSPANDGVTWTQLGATVTTVGAITLFPSTAPYEIGGRQFTSDMMTGKMYEVRLLSGRDTAAVYGSVPTVAPIFPEHWGANASTSPTSATGAPILHMSLGAVPGRGLAYLSGTAGADGVGVVTTDATRIAKMLPLYGHRAVFMATSHNDSGNNAPRISKEWASTWTTWITNVKAQAPFATPVIVTENPRISPAPFIHDHDLRREQQLTLAGQISLPVLDAYQAFLDTGAVSQYVQTDGIHPTISTVFGGGGGPTTAGASITGGVLWANSAYAALFPSGA